MMNKAELTKKLYQIQELKRMSEELNAELESLTDEVKAVMTEQNIEEMTVDIFKVRYTTVTSSRFDSTAFKKAHADLYGQYTKPTTSKRFTIS